MRAKDGHDVARLTQIETVERLVEHQQRVRREQPERDHHATMLALRELAESRAEQRGERQRARDVGERIGRGTVDAGGKAQHPGDRLVGEWTNAVGHEVEDPLPFVGLDGCSITRDRTQSRGRHAREAPEQCRLSGAVRSNQPEDFAGADGKARTAQRPERTEAFGQVVGVKDDARPGRPGGFATRNRGWRR